MKQIIIAFAFLALNTACNSKNGSKELDENKDISQEEFVAMNAPNRDLNEIEKDVFNGDTKAYEDLKVVYYDYYSEEKLFYWALIMANKYDYPPAYFDVYAILTYPPIATNEKIDDKTKEMALNYLKKAVEKGFEGAEEVLKEIEEESKNVSDHKNHINENPVE